MRLIECEGTPRRLPAVLEEIRATARAANVSETDLLALNLPLVPGRLDRVFAEPSDLPSVAGSTPSIDG